MVQEAQRRWAPAPRGASSCTPFARFWQSGAQRYPPERSMCQCFPQLHPALGTWSRDPLTGGTPGIAGTRDMGCLLPWSPGSPLHSLSPDQATPRTTQRNCTALVPEYGKHGCHQSSMRPSLEDRGGNRLPRHQHHQRQGGSCLRYLNVQRSGLQQKRARSLQKTNTANLFSSVSRRCLQSRSRHW